MLVSGVGQDKSHTGALINYVGNGVYNAVHHTPVEMIHSGFKEILKNPTYRYDLSYFDLGVLTFQC